MKNLTMVLCSLLLCLGMNGMAKEVQDARVRGKIKDFAGGEVSVMWLNADGEKKEVAIPVSDEGEFVYNVQVEKPFVAYLIFEHYMSSIDLFLENGMEAELDIAFHTEKRGENSFYVPEVVFTGDNADCYYFSKAHQHWQYNPWPFERLKAISFAQYREEYLEVVDKVKADLMEVKSLAFRRMTLDKIERGMQDDLFRYSFEDAKEDADFNRWMETIDRNDPENIEMSKKYVYWHARHHRPEGANGNAYFLNSLPKLFRNQEVINKIANEYIADYLVLAPKEMPEVFGIYKQITTDTAAHAEMQKLYDRYIKRIPGAEAIDFEMTDINGKKWHLSDFKGKALFIDIWATWCGPCCAEIPYVAKLVKHYAKNKKIEFLSISVDSNQAKWKKKLAADKPEWKQFICPGDWKSPLCKEYDITGIPRFLFLDKKGRVISLRAPFPSSPDIIEYIDGHIE